MTIFLLLTQKKCLVVVKNKVTPIMAFGRWRGEAARLYCGRLGRPLLATAFNNSLLCSDTRHSFPKNFIFPLPSPQSQLR